MSSGAGPSSDDGAGSGASAGSSAPAPAPAPRLADVALERASVLVVRSLILAAYALGYAPGNLAALFKHWRRSGAARPAWVAR